MLSLLIVWLYSFLLKKLESSFSLLISFISTSGILYIELISESLLFLILSFKILPIHSENVSNKLLKQNNYCLNLMINILSL